MNQALEPDRCPQCGGPNGCGIAQGQVKCWCFFVAVSKDVLAALPDDVRDRSCLCRSCATGKPSPTSVAEHLSALHRKR